MGFISDIIGGITEGVDKIGAETGTQTTTSSSNDAQETVDFLNTWAKWFADIIWAIRSFIEEMKSYLG